MPQRHFLVKEDDGAYQLREIDTEIANGIRQLGKITGHYHTVEATNLTFYFMNCSLSQSQADKIAEDLSQDLLNGKR